MTCIAALVHETHVYLAADTGHVMGGTINYDGHKLFTLPAGDGGDVAFGFAGDASLGAQVARHLKIADAPPEGDELRDWVAAIAEAIAGIAADANPPILDSGGHVDACGMLAFRGELWLLSQQSIQRMRRGYYAIGSGQDLGIGYIAAIRDQGYLKPSDVVEAAVRCAAMYDPHVNLDAAGPQLLTI